MTTVSKKLSRVFIKSSIYFFQHSFGSLYLETMVSHWGVNASCDVVISINKNLSQQKTDKWLNRSPLHRVGETLLNYISQRNEERLAIRYHFNRNYIHNITTRLAELAPVKMASLFPFVTLSWSCVKKTTALLVRKTNGVREQHPTLFFIAYSRWLEYTIINTT